LLRSDAEDTLPQKRPRRSFSQIGRYGGVFRKKRCNSSRPLTDSAAAHTIAAIQETSREQPLFDAVASHAARTRDCGRGRRVARGETAAAIAVA
jgi:hypothetical protein